MNSVKKMFEMKLTLILVFFLSVFYSAAGVADVNVQKRKPHIIFLISEDPDNYEATRTVPVFAQQLRKDHGFHVTVLVGEGPRSAYTFPGLNVLPDADVVVVFCRRLALSHGQLAIIRKYLKAGKPLVGVRTANHAFSVREEVAEGHASWWDFVPEILGCENRGYGPVEAGTAVAVAPGAARHPILQGVSPLEWHSRGNLYLQDLLDANATVLLTGTAEGKTEPIAWTRLTADKSRVFYTSLGYPDDFDKVQFQTLILNAINWALK